MTKEGNHRTIADYSEAIRLDPVVAVVLQPGDRPSTAGGTTGIADHDEAIRLDPEVAVFLLGNVGDSYHGRYGTTT